MQALCQWDVQQDSSEEALATFFDRQDEGCTELPRVGDEVALARCAGELVRQFWKHSDRIDTCLANVSTKWSLQRMSPVDRNVMRVAMAEILLGSVPTKVAINEAIEIGRTYGGKDSPGFINGVLDAAIRCLNPSEGGL